MFFSWSGGRGASAVLFGCPFLQDAPQGGVAGALVGGNRDGLPAEAGQLPAQVDHGHGAVEVRPFLIADGVAKQTSPGVHARGAGQADPVTKCHCVLCLLKGFVSWKSFPGL